MNFIRYVNKLGLNTNRISVKKNNKRVSSSLKQVL